MSSGGLRPLRVGEILDAAIKLYVRNARVLMGAAATVTVPLQLLTAIVLLSVYNSGQDIPTGFSGLGSTVPQADAAARAGASAIVAVIALIATALVTAACVKAISDAYLDQPASIEGTLRFALRRLAPLLGMEVLLALGLGIGFVLLVIPGIWLYARWGVATPALVIERRNPFRALGRSSRLVKGRWWPTAGVLLLANLMVFLVSGVIDGLLTAAASLSSHHSLLFAVVISTAAATVSGILVQPFNAAVTTVLYYDLRIRREGYDVELMAEQLGIPEASLPPAAPGEAGFAGPLGPDMVGKPGGPPYWPPPPGWQPGR